MSNTSLSTEVNNPTRAQITRWLISVTRDITSPLIYSTLFRIIDQSLSAILFGVGAGVIVLPFLQAAELIDPAQAPSFSLLLWVFIGLSLTKALARYLEQFLGHYVAFKALELLRSTAFSKLWPQAPAVLNRTHSGNMLAALTDDIDHIEVFFAHTFAPAVSGILVPTGFLIFIGVAIDPTLAFILAGGLVVNAFIIPLIGANASLEALKLSYHKRGELTESITDTLQGLSEVVGYGRESQRMAHSEAIEKELGALARRQGIYEAVRRGASRSVWALTLGMAAWYLSAGAQYFAGIGLAQSAFWALFALGAGLRLFDTVRGIEDFSVDLDKSFASAARVYTLVHEKPQVLGPTEPKNLEDAQAGDGKTGLSLSFENVSFTYPGALRPAVDNLSFSVSPGSHLCIVGVSGCGKTTAANLALRFFDAQSGVIRLGGRDITSLDLEELRKNIGLVRQSTYLFDDTILGNMRLANPQVSDEQIVQALRIANIYDEILAMEQGLETPLLEGGSRLSGGQRARLSLARALLREPRVLILDEYTAHLDPALEAKIRADLRAAYPGLTLVEITHRLGAINDADQVIVIDNGVIVQSGVPAQLLDQPGALRQLAQRILVS